MAFNFNHLSFFATYYIKLGQQIQDHFITVISCDFYTTIMHLPLKSFKLLLQHTTVFLEAKISHCSCKKITRLPYLSPKP